MVQSRISHIDGTPNARQPSRPHGQSILLVEDEDVARTIMRLALAHRGYRVFEAKDAATASRLWYENPAAIDLLIADLGRDDNSPSGLELARRFTKLNSRLKVLITIDRMIAQLHAPYQWHLMQKPFDLSQLAKTVRLVLDEFLEERAPIRS